MQLRESIEHHAQHVVQSGATARSHDSHDARQIGQRSFAILLEQSFRLEPPLQLLERDLQSADATRLHFLHVELERTARIEDTHAPAHDHFHAIGDFEAQPREHRLEHHGVDRAALVFQREVEMIGRRHPRIRDFADHPVFIQIGFERVANHPQQVRYANQARAAPAQHKVKLPTHSPNVSESLLTLLHSGLEQLLDDRFCERLAMPHPSQV